jgi:hypothetical protein
MDDGDKNLAQVMQLAEAQVKYEQKKEDALIARKMRNKKIFGAFAVVLLMGLGGAGYVYQDQLKELTGVDKTEASQQAAEGESGRSFSDSMKNTMGNIESATDNANKRDAILSDITN